MFERRWFGRVVWRCKCECGGTLCENVDVEEDGGDNRQSMCPNVTFGGYVDVDDRRFTPGVENIQILREELGSANVSSTPKRAAWSIYSKRRSSVLKERDEPVCKVVVFDVASGSGKVGGVEMLPTRVKVCLRVL